MCKIFLITTLLSLAFLEAKTSKITPRVPKSLIQNGCQMMANMVIYFVQKLYQRQIL
ncbi:MAG: hypothetical protein IE881_06435 [Epsilonproteobacteria bacterium]|nr:hypothetical protein [Campylobacterota bacterium]